MTLAGDPDIGLPGRSRARPLFEPERVVVDADGLAVTAAHAWRDYKIEPTVIYVRNDGWSLGAPAHLSSVAEKLWSGAWTEKWIRQGGVWLRSWPNGGVS